MIFGFRKPPAPPDPWLIARIVALEEIIAALHRELERERRQSAEHRNDARLAHEVLQMLGQQLPATVARAALAVVGFSDLPGEPGSGGGSSPAAPKGAPKARA